jgi:hypothetical protein
LMTQAKSSKKALTGSRVLYGTGRAVYARRLWPSQSAEDKVLAVGGFPSIRNAFLITSRGIWFATETCVHFQHTLLISIAWFEHQSRRISKPSKQTSWLSETPLRHELDLQARLRIRVQCSPIPDILQEGEAFIDVRKCSACRMTAEQASVLIPFRLIKPSILDE